MSPQLLHLFGPLFVNVYGLFIAIGVLTGLILGMHDKKLLHIIDQEKFLSFILYTMVAAVAGGRLLFAIEHWHELPSISFIFQFWRPGYSILGAVALATGFSFWYLRHYKIPALQVLDRMAIYVPLVQSIARIGCYFAGCCYGMETTVSWAVVYTHPQNLAPLFTPFHPTQLYSSALLFCLFVGLYIFQNSFTKNGQLLGLYLIGAGCERFIVDFLRAGRRLLMGTFSSAQYVALALIGIGLILFYKAQYAKRH